ncbi:hypothetical protein [Clostridium sp.]|uniref:hypothetical protein n=1 Tax=Clostridium sp. TaxID=1506 RepID=UPI002629C9BE|nr:hypothetical protein [Clostridium sp.]
MNGYNLVMKIQGKMQDPNFAARFNKLVEEFNSIPGMQEEVMKIAQIQDERKREKALAKLPTRVKNLVRELSSLLKD